MAMAMFACPKHVGAQTTHACPHVCNAIHTSQSLPAPEFREYSLADGELQGFGMGAFLCPHCVSEHALPPSGTAFAGADPEELDELLDRIGELFRLICLGCFEEWLERREQLPVPCSGFIDPSAFSFVRALESNWTAIREEYLAIPSQTFEPWVQHRMHGGGWSVFGLYALGRKIPAACEKCPETTRVVQQVSGLSMAGFSRLAPGARVTPHVGWAGSVFRLHLGLDVPARCGLRVASETRSWEEGRCLIFDDTVEHEAWNDSDSPRGVLLLDFLRPGVKGRVEDHLPEEVRQYVEDLFSVQS